MEPRAVADELSKLAELHSRGVLSDHEFQTQKRQVLSKGRHWLKLGLPVGAVAVLAITVTMLISLLGTPASTVTLSADITPSQVQTAISVAMQQVDHPTYNGLCLQMVADAYKAAGVSIGSAYDAVDYWNNNPENYTEHVSTDGPYGTPPAGALLFWGTTQWSSDGHVALSLGNGSVVSSAAYPYADGQDNGEVFALSSRNPTTYHYLGWLLPGTLQTPSPAPTPVVAPVISAPQPATPVVVSGPEPRPVGATSLQPAAGVGTLQGSATVIVGSAPSSVATPLQGGSSSSVATPPAVTRTPTPTTTTTTTPAAPTVSPPPPTYPETVGGTSHTWTDYANAGGTEGPSISAYDTVQIACKVTGFSVADGNTWWYRIASEPWNDDFYVSADAFYNNGETSGSLIGTPFVDTAVPNC